MYSIQLTNDLLRRQFKIRSKIVRVDYGNFYVESEILWTLVRDKKNQISLV